MQVNFNANSSSISSKPIEQLSNTNQAGKSNGFGDIMSKGLNKVNDQQADANTSISDLLSGKSQDINSVVASVAKADMSFKLLVGVRNKLVEAYKETMKMQV